MSRRRSRRKGQLPKGAYRVPTGGYVTEHTYVGPKGRRIRIRAVHRDEPDMTTLVQALIDIARDRVSDDDSKAA